MILIVRASDYCMYVVKCYLKRLMKNNFWSPWRNFPESLLGIETNAGLRGGGGDGTSLSFAEPNMRLMLPTVREKRCRDVVCLAGKRNLSEVVLRVYVMQKVAHKSRALSNFLCLPLY